MSRLRARILARERSQRDEHQEWRKAVKEQINLGGVLLTTIVGMALVLAALPAGAGPTLASPVGEEAQENTDPSGLRPPAWYDDPELGARWNRFTGRYIFERSCTSCHRWGPNYRSRAQWRAYFEQFPENHEPGVSRSYSDLTAMFRPADYVPSSTQRNDALLAFLLAEAPDSAGSEAERLAPYASLPQVGDMAPDFEIVDIEGHRHRVSEYRGEKQLVLVFSRAHW